MQWARRRIRYTLPQNRLRNETRNSRNGVFLVQRSFDDIFASLNCSKVSWNLDLGNTGIGRVKKTLASK